MISTEYKASEGETIAEICANHYGFEAGAVEKVIEQNPALIGFSHLSAGDVVLLPKLQEKPAAVVQQVGLWD